MNDDKYKHGAELCDRLCDRLTDAVNAGTDNSPESRSALDEVCALLYELAEELARKHPH